MQATKPFLSPGTGTDPRKAKSMNMDKYSSQLSYWVASLLAAAGAMTLQDWAVLAAIKR